MDQEVQCARFEVSESFDACHLTRVIDRDLDTFTSRMCCAVAAAVAVRAADEDVAEELHFDLLEARAAATFALALAELKLKALALRPRCFAGSDWAKTSRMSSNAPI